MTRHAIPSGRVKVKAEKNDKHRQERKGVEHVEQGFEFRIRCKSYFYFESVRLFFVFYFMEGGSKRGRVREGHACRFFRIIMANRSHFVVDLIIGRAEWRNKYVGSG